MRLIVIPLVVLVFMGAIILWVLPQVMGVSLDVSEPSGEGTSPDREKPPVVLLVGRAFTDHHETLQTLRDIVPRSQWRVANPVSVDFFAEDGVDLDSLTARIEKEEPALVIVYARSWHGADRGWARTLREQMGPVIEAIKATGAEIRVMGHPPGKPDAPIGFKGQARMIDAVTRQISEDAGVSYIAGGRAWAALPVDSEAQLYRTRGVYPSPEGALITSLAVTSALEGVDMAQLPLPQTALSAADLDAVLGALVEK